MSCWTLVSIDESYYIRRFIYMENPMNQYPMDYISNVKKILDRGSYRTVKFRARSGALILWKFDEWMLFLFLAIVRRLPESAPSCCVTWNRIWQGWRQFDHSIEIWKSVCLDEKESCIRDGIDSEFFEPVI